MAETARRALAPLLVLGLAFAGCSQDSTRPPDTAGPTPALTESPTGSPSAPEPESPAPGPAISEASPTEASPGPEPTPTVVEQWGIDWEDLENLAFEVDGETLQLENGQVTVSYGGASEDRYTLQNLVAQGDLNGDGYDDAVVHIVLASAGSGTFHLIVPVIYDGQGGNAQRPIWVGDRIVMESIEVRDGLVEVVLFDRETDESFTVISRRQTLEIDLSGSEPVVSVIDSQPLEALPPPGPDLPEVAIQFDPGAIGAIVAGSIEFRQRQAYSAHIAAGQWFIASLDAPLGVWLDVRLDDHVVASASDRLKWVQAELPAGGSWQISVVSAHAGPAEFKLYIEALPLESDQFPTHYPTVSPSDVDVDLPDVNSVPSPNEPAPVMYLTFDDGPHPVHTTEVLDVLARYGARATFFVVGSIAQHYPNTMQRMLDEGHTIGNHTWNHENLAELSREEFDETVGRTQEMLGDRGAACLRPPYAGVGPSTREWAAEHGLDLVTWDFSPRDWIPQSAHEIAQQVVDHARDGVIILLHDGGGDRSQTVLGLEGALSELSSRGYRFEPLCN